MRRSPWSNFGSLLLLGLLFAMLLVTPAPYVRAEPGSTYDALGKVDGKALVDISPTSAYRQYPTTGDLRLLTVSEWGGPIGPLALGDGLRALWDSRVVLQPTEFLYRPSVTGSQLSQQGAAQFESARSQAIAAALRLLKIPVQTRLQVAGIKSGAPADGKLKVNDIFVSVQGVSIKDFESLDQTFKALKAGQVIEVGVIRDQQSKTFKLKLASIGGKPRIGVDLMLEYYGPMSIEVQLDDVGGPSAGLAFALSIYDKLTPGPLLRGRTVAVTGTINAEGQVGAIGGLHQKLASAARAGARLMLIPFDNCADIAGDVPPELQIAPVATLKDALNVLSASGTAKFPVCPSN